MKFLSLKLTFAYVCFLFGTTQAYSSTNNELSLIYDYYVKNPSDINQHIPVLKQLAKECSSAIELGAKNMVPTWGILLGLSESSGRNRHYIGIDVDQPPVEKLLLARIMAKSEGISFEFLQGDDLKINTPETDLLFIDSYHTYAYLTAELEKYAPHTMKYIAMHDTSPPWGYA